MKRRCICCGRPAPGGIAVTTITAQGVRPDLPVCKSCSRDVNQLHALAERVNLLPHESN